MLGTRKPPRLIPLGSMLSEEYILSHGSQGGREKADTLWQRGISVLRPGFLVLLVLPHATLSPGSLHGLTCTVAQKLQACFSSLAKEGIGLRGVGAEAWEMLGGAGAGTGRCLCSFAHPSPPPSSPETSDSATSSIGDELWGPGLGRDESKGACSSNQAISQADPLSAGLADSAPRSAVMSRGANSTEVTELLVPGELGGAGAGGGVTWPLVPPAGTWRAGLGLAGQ